MVYSTLIAGINSIILLTERISSSTDTNKGRRIQAIGNLRQAINATEAYLTQSNGEYVPNNNLSEIWAVAFTSMIFIDESLAKLLEDKSRFWANPEKWLAESGAMELIPKLKELDIKCEELQIKLNN